MPHRLSSGSPTPKPCAIVLYSQEAEHCNFTRNRGFNKVFTLKGKKDTEDLLNGVSASSSKLREREDHTSNIQPDPRSGVGQGFIDPQTGMLGASGPIAGDGGAGDSSGSGGGGSNALIILYTITAIITILFLGVIIAGAVRAHRNPARYGPRAAVPNGRSRQTRAKGLARAMLETLPVVKFGDEEDQQRDVDNTKKDVEMADYDEEHDQSGIFHHRKDADEMTEGVSSDKETDTKHPGRVEDEISMSSGQIRPVVADQSALSKEISTGSDEHDEDKVSSQITIDASQPKYYTEDSSPICPICTDDFKKGENLRVLPCRHRFHSDCVDPWLVNVSGTCPLCRVDLNPEEEKAEGEDAAAAGTGPDGDQAIGNAVHTDANGNIQEGHVPVTGQRRSRRHHRLTGLLHQNVDVRLAALRRIRNHHAGTSTSAGPNVMGHEQMQHDESASQNVTAVPQRERSQSQQNTQERQQQQQQQQQQRPQSPLSQRQQRPPSVSSSSSSSASQFSRSMTHLPAPPPQSYQPSRPERSTVTGEAGTASDSASSINSFDRRGGTGRRSRFKKKLRSTIGLSRSQQ
ncbi:Zinc finger, RING/FYVE/PHD-type [Ascosphaera apis ARSEF 7405]|uniref:Zinc finger, RING/FYVE/PHD-type n=1 Tax=Ascosphaera apis ARSEF 7405 TaxID=392613 RepID=A0A167Z032_9EURO|nr:Zinc finger, RING/FYVE/PHD-type [Ascosphaera apis ARSEF 7405]